MSINSLNNYQESFFNISVFQYDHSREVLKPIRSGIELELVERIKSQVGTKIFNQLQPGDTIRALENTICIHPHQKGAKTLSANELKSLHHAIKGFFYGRASSDHLDPSELLVEIKITHDLQQEIEKTTLDLNYLSLQHEFLTKKLNKTGEETSALSEKIRTKQKQLERLKSCQKTAEWASQFRFDALEYLGDGAVKKVYGDNDHAYFIPKKGITEPITKSHEAEIREEVATAHRITLTLIQFNLTQLLRQHGFSEAEQIAPTLLSKGSLTELNQAIELGDLKILFTEEERPYWLNRVTSFFRVFADEVNKILAGAKNLAVDLEELPESLWIQNKYTVSTPKAYSNLEKVIVKEKNSLETKLFLASGFLNGMSELQKAGYVHGDIKPENCLVYTGYDKQGKPVKFVKISDFGKAQFLSESESRFYCGNSRFCPPEARLSRKGEVYGAAMTVIRILEEGHLKGDDMLITPSSVDNVIPLGKRRGIEKFAIASKAMPQSEAAAGLTGSLKAYGPRVQSLFIQRTVPADAEKEISSYIDALSQALVESDSMDPLKAESLKALLKDMTRTDPKFRPSMEEASRRFHEIWD